MSQLDTDPDPEVPDGSEAEAEEQESLKRILLKRGITVATVIAVLAFAVTYLHLAGKPVHRLMINYPTASGLIPGSDVFVAGAKVGTVSDVDPTNGDSALVVAEIDDAHWPLHQGLQAQIRPKSLLGEKYVDLHDGQPSRPLYDASKVLRASSDAVPVELDTVLNSLDPDTRAAVRTLLNDLGGGLAGRGPDLNAALQSSREDLDHLATTGQTLNNRDPDLDRILVGLDSVLQRITQADQLDRLSHLIDGGQQTLHAIEGERDAWSRSFDDAASALNDINRAVTGTVPNLRDLLEVAPGLLGNVQAETSLLADLGSSLTAGDRLTLLQRGLSQGATTSGGALEVYPDGRMLPIFRVCLAGLVLPTAIPGTPTNDMCTGTGFQRPGPQSVPQTASAVGNGASVAALAEMLGA